MNPSDPREQDEANDMDALSRAYRAARDAEGDNISPPPAIDDAIRAAARRAVQSGPRAASAGGFAKWTRKWTPQLSAAAVVVLSVSVIFVSMQERPDVASLSATLSADTLELKRSITPAKESKPVMMDSKILQEAAPPAMAFVPPPDTAKKRDEASANAYSIVLPAPKVSSQATAEREQRGRIAAAAEANVPVPEVVANAPVPPPVLSAPAAIAPPVYAPPAAPAAAPPPVPYGSSLKQNPAVTYGNTVDHKYTRPPTPAEPAAESQLLQKKEAAPSTASASQAPSGALAAGASIREKTVADQVRRTESTTVAAAAPAPPPVQAAAQAAVPAPATVRAAPTAASRVDSAQADVAKAKDASAGAGTRASASGAMQNYADKTAGAAATEASGPWLKRMLELREQGKLKELREELVRFKKAYPDIVLPKPLLDLPAE